MKLFVDDVRDCPVGWALARTYAEALKMLESGAEVVSLDHDLGEEKTGYDIACWLEERAFSGFTVPEIRIHSANPVGRANIEACIKSIKRVYGVV